MVMNDRRLTRIHFVPAVNLRLQDLQVLSLRSPIVTVFRYPLGAVFVEAQYGHFTGLPRGILVSPPFC
jgi:hypothetical protein